jgi:hypothetical protein
MQLGTRWSVGAEPPRSLPEALVERIRAVEAALSEESKELRWTLTWLEGRPVVELDDGTVVS